MPTKSNSNELKLTRVYDAPVAAVWNAWTDPEQAAKWWGPRGFSITTHSKVLKVGGHWHYTMHGPDGIDYPNRTVYFEVDKHKRLVYDHGANETQPPMFRVTVTFKALGQQTEMTMSMAFSTPEAATQAKKFVKLAGGNATWDRLAEYLAKEESDKDVFIINRSFEAPIEKVFEMWVNPKHFSQWMGPAGTQMDFMDADIAEGKTTFYKMSFESNMVMYGKMTYRKIQPTSYLEYSQIFTDEKGNLSKHPGAPTWPDVMLTKVFFSQEEDGETRVTLVWEPDGKFSAEELKAFTDMRTSMTQGWTQSFDKLEEMVDKKV